MIAAVYARKSTDQSDVSDAAKSVTRQIEQAKAYSTRKGWAVADAHVYADDGISGAEFSARPGFVRLMNALKPRPGSGVLIMSEESRLGREQIETSYSLKQILQAGVRVFYYLEDRERTLGSPTDKLLLSVTAFADELEREKARQRTYDAVSRIAKAGHVAGGQCFGYDNVPIAGPDGRRSHVERRINATEAAVVRRIFELCAAGYGYRKIAITLNDERAVSPRAQRGRSQSWAPSSVNEALHRPLYRGEIVWNATRKRDTWGRHAQHARPEAEWMRREAPDLRIVSEALWRAAYARLDAARATYLAGTQGNPWGRPPIGGTTKYLLSGLSRCAVCGGGLLVKSRAHGQSRAFFYGCSGHHMRGCTVCGNRLLAAMPEADQLVFDMVAEDLERPTVIEAALEQALDQYMDRDAVGGRLDRLADELAVLDRELANLIGAIAAGGKVATLLAAIQDRERRRADVAKDFERARREGEAVRFDRKGIQRACRERLANWRGLLERQAAGARGVVQSVLDDRIIFRPTMVGESAGYELEANLALGRVFLGILGSKGMASPTRNAIMWYVDLLGDCEASSVAAMPPRHEIGSPVATVVGG